MKKRLGHCFGESSRKSRVKMHKSGKHWVTTVVSSIGLIRFCKGLVEQRLRLTQKEEVETKELSHHLLKGAAALSAIVAGGAAQSAFADEIAISMDEEFSAESAHLANAEVVTLSEGVVSEVQEESTTQSETEISSASLSESLSLSLSQLESLSVSVSLSESLVQADSQTELDKQSESAESSSEVGSQAITTTSETMTVSSEQAVSEASGTQGTQEELNSETTVAGTLVALDDTEITYDASVFTYDGNTVSVKPVEEQVASDALGSTDLKWVADQTEGRVLFGIVELTDKGGGGDDAQF